MFMKTLKIAAIAAAPLLFAGGAMAVESITVPQQLPVKQGQKAAEQALTQELAKQGFTHVTLSHDGQAIQASGMRQNQELSLSYDLKTGDLTKVNGKPRLLTTSEAKPAKPMATPGHKVETPAKAATKS